MCLSFQSCTEYRNIVQTLHIFTSKLYLSKRHASVDEAWRGGWNVLIYTSSPKPPHPKIAIWPSEHLRTPENTSEHCPLRDAAVQFTGSCFSWHHLSPQSFKVRLSFPLMLLNQLTGLLSGLWFLDKLLLPWNPWCPSVTVSCS